MRSRVAGGALLSKRLVMTDRKKKRLRCSPMAFRFHGGPRTLIRVGGEQFRELMFRRPARLLQPQGVPCEGGHPYKVMELPGACLSWA
jgi:hypothetical protein